MIFDSGLLAQSGEKEALYFRVIESSCARLTYLWMHEWLWGYHRLMDAPKRMNGHPAPKPKERAEWLEELVCRPPDLKKKSLSDDHQCMNDGATMMHERWSYYEWEMSTEEWNEQGTLCAPTFDARPMSPSCSYHDDRLNGCHKKEEFVILFGEWVTLPKAWVHVACTVIHSLLVVTKRLSYPLLAEWANSPLFIDWIPSELPLLYCLPLAQLPDPINRRSLAHSFFELHRYE